MAKKSKRGSSGLKINWHAHISNFIHAFGIGLYFISKFLPVLLAGLLIGGMYHGIQKYLYADPYFRLDVIRVKSDLPFTSKEVEKISGLKLGENLLAIDLDRISKSIEKNPQIKRVDVKRALPNTIEIDVVRRFEVFQVRPRGQGRYFAIDDQGIILPKSDVSPLKGLVLIDDGNVPKRPVGIGDQYRTKNLDAFKALYQYVIQESELAGERIETMLVDHLGNFTVYLTGGFEVRLGKSYVKNLKKLRGLKNLLQSDERSKIEYLDLQYQDVVVKMKEDQRLKL